MARPCYFWKANDQVVMSASLFHAEAGKILPLCFLCSLQKKLSLMKTASSDFSIPPSYFHSRMLLWFLQRLSQTLSQYHHLNLTYLNIIPESVIFPPFGLVLQLISHNKTLHFAKNLSSRGRHRSNMGTGVFSSNLP